MNQHALIFAVLMLSACGGSTFSAAEGMSGGAAGSNVDGGDNAQFAGAPSSGGSTSGGVGQAAGSDTGGSAPTSEGGASATAHGASAGTAGAGGPSSGTSGTGGAPSGGVGDAGGEAGAGVTAGNGGSSAGGSGGVGGSGGKSGAPGGGGGGVAGSGGSPTLCGQAGMIVCDDFDSRPVGPVSGSPWVPGQYCTTQTDSVVDTQSYSGQHALLSSTLASEECGLHTNIGAVSDFYVHARVKFAKAPGNGDQFDSADVSLFSVNAGLDYQNGIRVGFMGTNLCPSNSIDIHFATADIWGCTGLEPTTDVWHCFELHVTTTDTTTTADLSIDGQDQAFTVQGKPVQAVTQPAVTTGYLSVGTASYNGVYKSPVYVDDVAVSGQPIGCQ